MTEQSTAAGEAAIRDIEREFQRVLRQVRVRWKDLALAIHPDLTPIGARLLTILVEEGPTRSTDLADRLTTDKSVLSRQLAQLEELGLIHRRADSSDGRARVAVVEPAVAEQVTALRSRRRRELLDDLASWTNADLEQLAELMRRLVDVL